MVGSCCKSSKMTKAAILVICIPAWLSIANNQNHGELSMNENTNAKTVELDSEPTKGKKMVSADVLGYEMVMIDGTKKSFEDYRGKVILMVNVASECGLTPQYEELEALYRKYKKQGLVVIGFPANEFGAQEPGSDAEIAQFCSSKYDVTFPMTSKIHVKGKETHPLYQQLAAQPEPIGGEPEWNFAKFMVDQKGNVVARFSSRTTPDDPALVKKLEELLLKD